MTHLDTNVLIDLLEGDKDVAERALRAIEATAGDGPVGVCAAVYAEYCAGSQHDVDEVAHHLRSAGIDIGSGLEFETWREAARTFSVYVSRRRTAKIAQPRRILADFIIGAYALANAATLVTRDAAFFRRSFSALKVVDPT